MDKNKLYKVIFMTLFIIFWSVPAVFAATVTAEGQGGSERTALHEAMRSAIEQQIGVYVDSRTYVENYQVIHDRIYTQADGYVRDYQILDKSESNGIWKIVIRAEVSDERLRADLMTKVQKKAVIGANMMDPRIGVLALNSDGTEDEALENMFIAGLHNEGFTRIIDLNQIDASIRNRIASADFEGDWELRDTLSTQFSVDYLVKASINKSGRNMNWNIPVDDPNLPIGAIPLGDIIPGLQGLNRADITVSVRMMNMNTGEIVYAGSGSGKGNGRDAEGIAMRRATENLMRELADAAIRKAANPEQHVTVIITDNALGSMSQAYMRIASLPGVSHVFTRSTSHDNIQVDVDYLGTAYDLAVEMERAGIAIKEMNSEYIKI